MRRAISTKEAVELFFENPFKDRQPPGQFSVLYLLRRDISLCLGLDPDTDQPTRPIPWPGAMAVLAGIDLLGKHYAGTITGTRTTFKKFLAEFFGLSELEQEIIYQLRCAFMHSFALYTENGAGQPYRFNVNIEPGQPLIQGPQTDKYVVALLTLGDAFEHAVQQYHEALLADESLQRKFARVFEKQGSIEVVLF